MECFNVKTDGPDQTRDLGRLLGEEVPRGIVVLLNGDLGAGKTCFAQGVALGTGVPESIPVTSPTYTLLNIHHGRFPLYHFDLYRLARVDDLADLGYDEFAEGEGLTLVEWADRMSGGLRASVSVQIESLEGSRRGLCFTALDARGRELVEKIAEKWTVF